MQSVRIKRSGMIVISRRTLLPLAFLPLAIFLLAAAVGLPAPLDPPPFEESSAGEAPLPDGGTAPFDQPGRKTKLASPGTSGLPETSAPEADSAAGGKPSPHERLVIGDAYTLEVKRGGVARSFGGNLLKANEKWIVLRRIASGRNDYGVPLLSALPKVGGYFRRSYESLVEDDLWIPRDAATIESHHHVTAAAKSTVGEQPAARTKCGVFYARGEKFERRDGELTAITDDKLTVLTLGPFRAPYPQQVARDELLCISIPVVISKVKTTERDSSKDSARK